jgi:hypothetical protein
VVTEDVLKWGVVAGGFVWVNAIWAKAVHALSRVGKRASVDKNASDNAVKTEAIREAGEQGVVLTPPGLDPVPKPAP